MVLYSLLFDFFGVLALIISCTKLLRKGVAFAFNGELGDNSPFSIILSELFKKFVISCKILFLDFSLNQEAFCNCVLLILFNLFPMYCFKISIVLCLRAIKFLKDFSLILFTIL